MNRHADEPRSLPPGAGASMVEISYVGGPYDGLVNRIGKRIMPGPVGNTLYLRLRWGRCFHGYVSHEEWAGQAELKMYWAGVVALVNTP